MFSEAISSIWSRWRCSSWPIAAASSGSAAASGAVKKRSGLASGAAVLRAGMRRGPDVVKGMKARSPHLGDATRVAPAFEFGGEERLDAILGDLGAQDAPPKHQEVGAVGLACAP